MTPKAPKPKPEKQVRAENARLLAAIGLTVRNERAKRGMTRRVLAAHCQTSERYLAQIESGEGNPSVLVLDAIARALDLDPIDLLPTGAGDDTRRKLQGRLRQMNEAQLAALLQSLDTPSGPSAPQARARRIALIGLRGAGKSTLGAALADRLGCAFIELDKMIEREHGAPVSTLFEVYGQGTFRRYERECLDRITAEHEAAVIAAAGGIVADERTFSQLLGQAHVIWLKASPADHMRRVMEQGDFRPMARNREAMNDLVAILEARKAEYGRSHVQLETSGKSVERCVEELVGTTTELFR